MSSRPIRISWGVYERLAQMALILDRWTPGQTITAFLSLNDEDRDYVRAKLHKIPSLFTEDQRKETTP